MDDDVTDFLKCDIEFDLSGPNYPTIYRWTAEALRRLADDIENGYAAVGHKDIKDKYGKKIGEIYFDHYGQAEDI